MAVNVKKYIAAGFDRLEFHLLDSAGYAAGSSGSVTPGGVGAPGTRILAVKTMDIQIPEPEDTDITGDDIYQGGFVWPPGAGPAFTIEMAVNNLTNDAGFQGTLTENLGDITLGVEQPVDMTFPDVALLAVSRARSKEAGSDGVSGFAGVIIPKTNVTPLGRAGFNERGEAVWRYRVKASTSDADPWGKTYTNATQGTSGVVVRPWTAENRVTMHSFVGDGSTVAFTVAETPASTSITTKVIIFKDGLRVTSGVTVSGKILTFSVAPANGAKIVVFYEYTI